MTSGTFKKNRCPGSSPWRLIEKQDPGALSDECFLTFRPPVWLFWTVLRINQVCVWTRQKQRERKINQNEYFLKVYEILINEPTDTYMDTVVSPGVSVEPCKGLWKGGVDNHQGEPVLKCLWGKKSGVVHQGQRWGCACAHTHTHTHTSEDTRCAKKKGELSLSMDFMRKKQLKYHSCKSLELEKAPCKIWDLGLNLRDAVRKPKIRWVDGVASPSWENRSGGGQRWGGKCGPSSEGLWLPDASVSCRESWKDFE